MKKSVKIVASVTLVLIAAVAIYITLAIAFFLVSPLLIWINKDFFSAFPFPVMTLENLRFTFEVILTPITSLIIAIVAVKTLKIVVEQTKTMNRNHEATHAPLILLDFRINNQNKHLMMRYSNVNDKMSSTSSDFLIRYKMTRSYPSGDPIEESQEKHYTLLGPSQTVEVDISESLIKGNNCPVEIEILDIDCDPCYTDSFSVAGIRRIKYHNGHIYVLDLWSQKAEQVKKR